MRSRARSSVGWIATVALLGACAGGPPVEDVYCDPPRFGGFPNSGSEDIVFMEARLDPDHASELDVNLLAAGYVPVKLSVLLKGREADITIVRVVAESWDARLFLLDGAVLRWTEAEDVVESLGLDEDEAKRLRTLAFRPGLVGTTPLSGYVFFRLDPHRFPFDGRKVVHVERGLARPLRLEDSLLCVNLTLGDRSEPFYVGIRP